MPYRHEGKESPTEDYLIMIRSDDEKFDYIGNEYAHKKVYLKASGEKRKILDSLINRPKFYAIYRQTIYSRYKTS